MNAAPVAGGDLVKDLGYFCSYLFFFFFNLRAEGKLLSIKKKIKNLFKHAVAAEHQCIPVIFLDIRGNFNLVFSLVHSRFSSIRRSGENAGLLGCQQLYGSPSQACRMVPSRRNAVGLKEIFV